MRVLTGAVVVLVGLVGVWAWDVWRESVREAEWRRAVAARYRRGC